MSLPIDVLQERFSAEKEQSKALEEEVVRLRNERSSVWNDSAEIGGEGRSVSENDEYTTESGVDSPECLEPQLTDAGDLYKNLQTALDAAGESNRVNRELCDSIKALQTTLDRSDQHEVSDDDRDVQELRDSLKYVQTELDHVDEYNMKLQSDLVAANEANRELRAANEQLQSQLDAACETNEELSERNGELQMALDDADKLLASCDGDYVQELENRLGEIQLELDTAHVSNQELQNNLKTMSATSENDAQRKETSKPTAKTKRSPGESEQLKLKDRKSVYSSGTW